eukprot:5085854-Lingulodinium_polyedra.AAC.1
MASSTPSAWSGRRLRMSWAPAFIPTCRPKCSQATRASCSMAGRAPSCGNTATASLHWSGPQTVYGPGA